MLHPEFLGLILSGQPISVLADLSAKFDVAGQEVFRGLEPVLDDDLGEEASPKGEQGVKPEDGHGGQVRMPRMSTRGRVMPWRVVRRPYFVLLVFFLFYIGGLLCCHRTTFCFHIE